MKTPALSLLSLASLALAFGLTHPAHAQIAVGVTYSASHINFDSSETSGPNSSPTDWLSGPTFSAMWEHGPVPFIKFGADARYAILRHGNNGVNAADAGFRLAAPISRLHIEPYFEFLTGYVGAREGSASTHYTGHIDLQTIAGLDILLRHHLAFRALEYSYGNIYGGGEDIRNQFSSGLLVRF